MLRFPGNENSYRVLLSCDPVLCYGGISASRMEAARCSETLVSYHIIMRSQPRRPRKNWFVCYLEVIRYVILVYSVMQNITWKADCHYSAYQKNSAHLIFLDLITLTIFGEEYAMEHNPS